jgi:hypothetical protein
MQANPPPNGCGFQGLFSSTNMRVPGSACWGEGGVGSAPADGLCTAPVLHIQRLIKARATKNDLALVIIVRTTMEKREAVTTRAGEQDGGSSGYIPGGSSSHDDDWYEPLSSTRTGSYLLAQEIKSCSLPDIQLGSHCHRFNTIMALVTRDIFLPSEP